MEKCRCCDGDGITDQTLDGRFDDPLPDYLECGVCDGKGFVNKNGDYFPPEKICPICGSIDIESRTDMRSMNPLGAGLIFIEEVLDHCNACKHMGDFAGENDGRIETAIREAITKRAIESLDKLAEQGNTATWIERCLGLEIGFLKRCRANNDFSRETYTLLRFIECQPELLTLAKLGYPPIEKVITRIYCDPSIASSSDMASDVGNIVAKGEDWIDIEVTDEDMIEKLLKPKTIRYSMDSKIEFMGVDV